MVQRRKEPADQFLETAAEHQHCNGEKQDNDQKNHIKEADQPRFDKTVPFSAAVDFIQSPLNGINALGGTPQGTQQRYGDQCTAGLNIKLTDDKGQPAGEIIISDFIQHLKKFLEHIGGQKLENIQNCHQKGDCGQLKEKRRLGTVYGQLFFDDFIFQLI